MAILKKGTPEIPWPKALQEATGHLSRLIQFDTTNPAGNELPAAHYLAEVLRSEGLEPVVVEPAPGRGSVIARLKGTGEKPPLLLLSHLDVVPAVREGWRRDPFGGEVADGEIWGRGALDCKGLTAAWLELVLLLKRTGHPLQRDVIFAATADEEMGGTWGVKWLSENRFDLIQAEYALNEGGGSAFRIGQQTYYTYQTAEKAICWVRLRARGTGGHASIPLPDNALVYLAKAISALGTRRLPVHVTPTTPDFINAL
ncbi:MAG: M20/M25/M40 family metallo-hydrolase, partial [Firmicutes bacterium]|nr:M20/M25/M40 family metallo-hydrolase [Bacillota bacterium]